MSTTIASSIPPGYRKLKPGREILEGDLLWNFVELKWQAADEINIRCAVVGASYVIRKIAGSDQEQSESQPIPSSYGDW